MRRHWMMSKHFAERVYERVQGDYKPVMRAIAREFNSTVLQKVFLCLIRGGPQRVEIDDYTICYTWDESKRLLVITTIF